MKSKVQRKNFSGGTYRKSHKRSTQEKDVYCVLAVQRERSSLDWASSCVLTEDMGHSPPLLVIPRWSHYNPFVVGRITKKPSSCLPPADVGDRILGDQGLRIWRHTYQKCSSSDSQKAETISSLAKIQVSEFYIAVISSHLGVPGSSSPPPPPRWPLSGQH